MTNVRAQILRAKDFNAILVFVVAQDKTAILFDDAALELSFFLLLVR